ncbi:R3H and coiled-coil domain-containing protein 1 [Gouania willdenowi]|uniref:R3H and coiled-coil domain-containing protein 1 n=1 Tax=Gouania willdenowi TaxID=441366 RepID=UPI001055ED78|nr:R3H and coiled-coil domain-containing protein 1 [Gouania willdenowi]
MHHVKGDLEQYQQRGNHRSVLLFPPLPSRLRFLIHRIVEDRPELSSFSVGESWSRRVGICPFELRGDLEEERKNNVCEEPSSVSVKQELDVKPKVSAPPRHKQPKRPDKPVYIPRANRERLSQQNLHEQTPEQLFPGSAQCVTASVSSSSESSVYPESTNLPKDSYTKDVAQCAAVRTDEESADACCQGDESQEEEEDVLSEQNPDTEDLADEVCPTDNTISDMDDVIKEIKAHLIKDAIFSIEHAHNDYSLYENVCINFEDFGHVIEIYNFPTVLNTADLYDAFTEYSEGGMKIKWVDHTHALGVFSSEAAALHALSISHPLLKARALAEGSKMAQNKAIRCADFIHPVKERPKTDCAVANRMVTSALGIRRKK